MDVFSIVGRLKSWTRLRQESSTLNRILNLAVVVSTLIFVTLSASRFLSRSRNAEAILASLSPVPNWVSYADGGVHLGSRNPRVTVVVFFDYSCPACGELAKSMNSLLRRYSSDLSVVYRHFPRSDGVARAAAIAAECGHRQGRFPEVHSQLVAQIGSLGRMNWTEIARQAGVQNLERFRACMGDTTAMAVVASDLRAAYRLGVKVTPTVLLEGRFFEGSPPLSVLDAFITRSLADGTDRYGPS